VNGVPIGAPSTPVPAPIAPSEADLLAMLHKAETPQAYLDAAKTAAPGIDALVQAKVALTNPIQLATAALAAGDLASAQAIRTQMESPAAPTAPTVDLAILDAALAVAASRPDEPTLDRLAERGTAAASLDRQRAQIAATLFAALGGASDGQARAALAGFDLGPLQAPAAGVLSLDIAAASGLKGEAGLLALTIAEPGGEAGPKPGDRAVLIQALMRAGLDSDARAFALEGLVALEPR
jgi:hypothetical protein